MHHPVLNRHLENQRYSYYYTGKIITNMSVWIMRSAQSLFYIFDFLNGQAILIFKGILHGRKIGHLIIFFFLQFHLNCLLFLYLLWPPIPGSFFYTLLELLTPKQFEFLPTSNLQHFSTTKQEQSISFLGLGSHTMLTVSISHL